MHAKVKTKCMLKKGVVIFICKHLKPIKRKGELIARGEILDQDRNVVEILIELEVANKEGM